MRRSFSGLLLGAVLALTLLLAACGGGDADGGDDAGPARNVPAPGGEATEDDADPAAGLAGRKIVRTASLELVIDDLDTTLRDVRTIAAGAGGFVGESNIIVGDSGGDASVERIEMARLTLRVPASSFEDVMQRLRDSARSVRSETSQAAEVTAEYTDLESRLRNLRAAEQQYIALLGQAQSIPDILTVQGKIDEVRGQIEQAQGRLNVLDDQTELATISLTLRLASAAPAVNGGWAQQSWDAAWSVTRGTGVVLGSVAIVVAVLSAWVLPIGLVALIGWRLFGRRITAAARWLNSL